MHRYLSVVIPAFNEEKVIGDTIKNIHEILNDLDIDFEIIVSNNNSTDNTADLAIALGCKVVLQEERSIGKTRNFGAKNAKGDLLLFVDADTRITKKLIQNALSSIDNGCKIVSAISTFDKYRTLSSYGVWIYNLLSYFFKLGNGQFIMIRKSDFDTIGGFDTNLYAFEEIELFKTAKRKFSPQSIKVLFTPVITSGRKFAPGKDQWTFILQLLGVLLNKPIGKSKRHLEFWYGKQSETKSSYKKYLLILLASMLFVENFWGQGFGVINDYKNLTTLFIFIGMASLIFEKRAFVVVTVFTFILEYFGKTTGMPFGSYSYSDFYSAIGLFGVPIFIPIAWYLLISATTKLFENPIKIGLSIVFIDVFLEKFAEINNIWSWNTEFLLTSPLTNYVSWFVVTILFYRIIRIDKISQFYSTAILLMLCSYIGVNLIINGFWYGAILLMFSLFLFGYSVNKRIRSFY